MIASMFVAVVLASGAPAPASAPSSASRAQSLATLPATDEDIRRGLFEMHARDPQKVVCSVRVHTGSRQPRTTCGTLEKWFDNRLPQEISEQKAPWMLVEEIKERRRKALMRSRSGA